MKIRNLLEGIIKVPHNTTNQAMTIVCSDVLSRIMTMLNASDDDFAFEAISIYKNIIKQMQTKYGDFDIVPNYSGNAYMTHKVYLSMKDLPKGYVRNKKNSSKQYLINIKTKFVDDPKQTAPSAEYYKKRLHAKSALINVYVPDMSIHFASTKPEYFQSLMHRYEGVIDHELTHAIQDMAFGTMPDELDYYNPDGSIDYDKYHAHHIEYDPLIKTEAKDFISALSQIRVAGHKPSVSDIHEMAMIYVGSKKESNSGYNAGVSSFFADLKKNDISKWKKAVKYFYGLIQSHIKV